MANELRFPDLRAFLTFLESRGELLRVTQPVSPDLEMTAWSDATLKREGPALLFTQPARSDGTAYDFPALTNLFGTPQRIVWGMGQELPESGDWREPLRDLGRLLAYLKEPEPPRGWRDAWEKLPLLRRALDMGPKRVGRAPVHEVVWEGDAVDLTQLPIQRCWPEDVAPLITWGLVVTRGPHKKRQNLGIYRQQLIDRNRVIMRWLSHRGGALDFAEHQKVHPGEPFPVAVVLGCDPATILAAVTPIPDTLSEYQFAGLLRGEKTELTAAGVGDLEVPARAEIVLEGFIHPGDTAQEGPYGDHTGYYNERAEFPVLTVTRVTMRRDAIYHTTYTGKPPDEPAVLGMALNEVFVPLLQRQYPEIVDFYLPPEGCSYRLALVAIKKAYPGHARRVMFGVWGFLRQFMYTKFIIVVDDDVDIRSWPEVIWALTTRVDAARDTMVVENTPIDYLDFASPVAGLGSKMGIDATNKWPGETTREWGRPITMPREIIAAAEAGLEGLLKKGSDRTEET